MRAAKRFLPYVCRQKNDITGYTPYGARSLDELQVHNEFFDQSGIGISAMVFAERHDGGNILNLKNLKEMVEVSKKLFSAFEIFRLI